MAVLRPMFVPTVGIPQTVVASRRPRTMSQREFYSQGVQKSARPQLDSNELSQGLNPRLPSDRQDQTSDSQGEFEQPALTGDYIQEQLSRMSSRAAPPMLEPIGRVKSPAAELVQPSNFETYYKQLEAIRGTSAARSGAAVARSNYQRQGGGAATNNNNSGGQNFGSGIPSNPKENFKYAQQFANQFGWGPNELSAWYTLGMKESGWRNTAQNPTSTAYGIGQFLNSTWGGTGIAKTSDPSKQVLAMARYIQKRYGSPSKALAFHISHNWY